MASRIAGVENVPHVVGTGENRVLLVLPDVYSSFGAALGVTHRRAKYNSWSRSS
ncbi:MAG: hypothetical protein KME52_04830 [Desmonostoc geniculatum HA4340-LM1]|jgi:hypothetical protein|nr:hypothetical protein [Desmonostoc geniculatum HA4340-LM1]